MDTVVIVDNSSKWTANYKRMLAPLGEEVNCVYFCHAEEAMQYISEHSVQVLVSELEMPVISGGELFEMVDMLSPQTVKVGITQVHDAADTLEALNRAGLYKLILKPLFVAEDFTDPIRAALEHCRRMEQEKALERKAQKKLLRLDREMDVFLQKIGTKKQVHGRILEAMAAMTEANLSIPAADAAPEVGIFIRACCKELMDEFFQDYMYEKKNFIFYLSFLKSRFHHPKRGCVFEIGNKVEEEIPAAAVSRIAYMMFLNGFLCEQCLQRYHIENVLEEEAGEYRLSVRYGWRQEEWNHKVSPEAGRLLQRMTEELERTFSDRMAEKEAGEMRAVRLYFRREEGLP